MKKDRYFPGYHFRPEKNWMNDPNGLIWKDGWYHLFFQYNPGADIWGDIHWGHARSKDLFHWEMCPIALAPSVELGEIHCYSGCAVEDEKKEQVRLFYTSIGTGDRGPECGAQQWSAVNADRELMEWKKTGTPALSQEINGEYMISMWRDPFIWKEEDVYRLLLSGTYEEKGCIALYESKDLENWKFRSILYRSKEYSLIECPSIMKFKDQYVLLYSPLDAVRYAAGTIDPETMEFLTREEGIFDYSVGKKGFYAPNIYLNDPKGRYLVMGCLFEGDRLNAERKRGWAGMQSLPREVLFEEGKLVIRPAEECRMLRKEELAKLDEKTDRMEAKGEQVEICLTCQPQADTVAEITVLASEDGRERTVLTLDYGNGRICLNRRNSTLYEDITTEDITAPLGLTDEAWVDVFVDHSAVEVYYNGEATLTARVFPKQDACLCSTVISGQRGAARGHIYRLDK